MSQYRIVYLDQFGSYIGTIYKFNLLEFGRSENKFSSLSLDLPPIYTSGYFRVDGRLEVWRKPDGSDAEYLEGETQWFIRLVREKTDEQGMKLLHILAYDAVQIVDRRIVAYYSEDPMAKMEEKAEVMIKKIMRQNFGSLAIDPSRNISQYLAIQPDLAQTTVTMNKSFAWQKILPLIQDICDESYKDNDEYLAFDIVRISEMSLEFRTYAGQRGVDRGLSSGSPMTFSYENLSLNYASIAFDSMDERNFIYAGGQGYEDNRVIKTAYNSARISMSPFNRCEDFYNASHNSDSAEVQSDANAQLAHTAAKVVFNGHIAQIPGKIFGVDYNFGDIVTAKIGEYQFDVHLSSYSIRADEGKEEVSVFARNLDDSEY